MRGGYKMELHPAADEYELRLYIDRDYEPAMLSLFDKVLRPGDVVVDVGANLGLMTLHAAPLVGATGVVIAIEPHPEYHQRLIGNIALNHLTNVRPLATAVGAVSERRVIYDLPAVNIGRSSLIDPGTGGRRAGVVPVERLDMILADMGIGAVRLLKIDVEGFEFEVLKGAIETVRKHPIICMEFEMSLPTEGWDHFSSHDLVMDTGNFRCFRFAETKFKKSPLVEIRTKEAMKDLKYDNVVYISREMSSTLPSDLFLR
jgi:FkbM family methyltransferase